MKKFLKIIITKLSLEQKEILTAELAHAGFYAFEENDDELIAYVLQKDFYEEAFKKTLPAAVHYSVSEIEDKNWNKEWESSFDPVVVDDFVAIRASFHKPVNAPYEIIITPKMSFGTGHHSTTLLMIQLMQKIDFANKRVLDFGTGTGILAILAEKLGASSIIAIDNDEWSISNARENTLANKCTKILLQKQDNTQQLPDVDIITANINFNVLASQAGNLGKILTNESLLLISGILIKDEQSISEIFNEVGILKQLVLCKEEWVSILFKKQ